MQKKEVKYLLGIDAGGTKCIARLTNINGETLGIGIAGAANIAVNSQLSIANIINSSMLAYDNADVHDTEIANTYAAIGVAGLEIPGALKVMNNWQHPYKKMIFNSDMHIACLGAHQGKNGSVLSIGTGIAGYDITNNGSKSTSGWGFPLADIGSGAWLGLRCIQETLNAVDGIRKHSLLTKSILAKYDNANSIPVWAKTAISAQYANHAKDVVKYYNDNDNIAIELINEQIKHIETFLKMMINKNPEKLSLVGGLAEFLQPLLSIKIQNKLNKPLGDATSGALIFINNHNNFCNV